MLESLRLESLHRGVRPNGLSSLYLCEDVFTGLGEEKYTYGEETRALFQPHGSIASESAQ